MIKPRQEPQASESSSSSGAGLDDDPTSGDSSSGAGDDDDIPTWTPGPDASMPLADYVQKSDLLRPLLWAPSHEDLKRSLDEGAYGEVLTAAWRDVREQGVAGTRHR